MAPGFRLSDALREVAEVASYPAIGHALRRRAWDPADLAVDLTGKVAMVTGGSSGLGLAIARGLAGRGATVAIVCRDARRGEEARGRIAAAGRIDRVHVELADLASVAAVRALAERFASQHGRIDVLVHNAGVILRERRLSEDGLEMTFATNVLGGFLLTHHLRPLLVASAPARVVHMTSALIYCQRLDVDGMLSTGGAYHGSLAYARSKRAVVELGQLWAERLAGTGVTSSCVHPGLAHTPGVDGSFPLYARWLGPVLRDADQGADTALWLAVSKAVRDRSGELWFDRRPRPAHVVPWTKSPRAEAERLWDACAKLGCLEAEARS